MRLLRVCLFSLTFMLAAFGGVSANLIAGDEPVDAKIVRAARVADRVWQQRLETQYVLLDSATEAVRLQAIRALADLGDVAAAPRISRSLQGQRSATELIDACNALLALHATNSLELVRRLSTHTDAQVRLTAVHVADRLGSQVEWRTRLKDEEVVIRGSALHNEAILGINESAAVLAEGLRKERNSLTRRMCAWGLGRINASTQTEVLLEGLCDSNTMVRRACADSLALMGHRPAIPYVIRMLEASNDPGMLEALTKLSKQQFGYQINDIPTKRAEAIARADRWWGENQDKKE